MPSDPASDPAAGPAADRAADLALALELADAVDALTLARFGALDLQVDTKPDLTPVSDADRAAEQLIRTSLAVRRPDDAILGEEFGTTGTGPRRWVIDPIDGTKNYVRGVPVWATLIALLDGEEPVLGVVSAPALTRRWWAAAGLGAFVRALGAPPRRLGVSAVGELGDASLGYSSLTGWATIGRDAQWQALMAQVWRTRGYGDFWPYMMVAEGVVDIAAEPELSLWDMAALAPVVTEAGGTFTGVDGTPGLGGGNALATNGRLHRAVLDALRAPA